MVTLAPVKHKKILSKDDTVVLVNPPNEQIVLRDLYSSTISKGIYNWPNVDLLCLSGILRNQFNVQLIDANTLGLSRSEAVKRIVDLSPGAIIFSFGNSVKEDDYAFIRELRAQLSDIKICGTGGLLYHNAEKELEEHPEFDASILNFTTQDILKYLNDDFDDLNNFVYRVGETIISRPKNYYENEFLLDIPLHEQLPLKNYQVSHGRSKPLTSVLTAYGCPSKCGFCVSGRINYRYRSADNVISELEHVKQIGVKEIFFRDNVFGAVKKQAFPLMNQMIENDYRFSWIADTRANLITEESAPLMKKSGCHALHIGVETATNEILKKYHKGLTVEKMKKPFKIARANGIQTLGYFIVGLPGETLDDIKRTIDFAIELDCDFASFNMPIPIIGTDLRDEAIQKGWVNKKGSDIYDGSISPIIETDQLTRDEILQMKTLAFRKFYLRPSFMLKKIVNIRTLFQVEILLKEFAQLLKRQLIR
jgi:anaerobic magnesium-protoporphyrin IX monomethyl ester cyclase